MKNPCQAAPPEELRAAVDEFNAGAWFQCHETLEELWAGEKGETRDLYQGMLQVAVALYHWRNGNHRGAAHLLVSGARLLDRVTPFCMGIDVAALLRDTERFRKRLEELGPEKMTEVDAGLVPRIGMVDAGGEKTES